MLLVVLGAGASYDAVPAFPSSIDHDDRMPLTDDLFRRRYEGLIEAVPRMTPVVPELRAAGGGAPLELILEGLQEQARDYPERLRQLMAVRYYLHMLIAERDQAWYDAAVRVTNYARLFDEIRRLVPHEEPVAIVTFNYDRLIEWALRDIGEPLEESMDGYVSGRFKVFKMHGSVDWGRDISEMPEARSSPDGFSRMEHYIAVAPDIKLSNNIRLVRGEYPIANYGNQPMVPAMAIPLQRKQDFELPAAHLAVMRELLHQADNLLVIGWKAADDPFLIELREHAVRGLPGTVVSGTNPDAVAQRFRDFNIRGGLEPIPGGFTAFLESGGLRDALAEPLQPQGY